MKKSELLNHIEYIDDIDILRVFILNYENALEFYSNKKNYESGLVNKDNGHIATHTQNLIKQMVRELNKTKEEKYNEAIKKIDELIKKYNLTDE